MLSNSSFLLHCWLFFLIFLVLCCFQFSGRFELCICYFSGSLDEFKWNRCSTDWNLELSNSGISLPTPTRRSIKPVLVACRVRFVSTAVDEIAFARLSQPAFFSSFFFVWFNFFQLESFVEITMLNFTLATTQSDCCWTFRWWNQENEREKKDLKRRSLTHIWISSLKPVLSVVVVR